MLFFVSPVTKSVSPVTVTVFANISLLWTKSKPRFDCKHLNLFIYENVTTLIIKEMDAQQLLYILTNMSECYFLSLLLQKSVSPVTVV